MSSRHPPLCYRAGRERDGNNLDLAGKAAGGRKLIAVVYADMVGYSRLIGLDDAGTLRRLRTLRRALIDPAIREHGGRVAQTGGDSLLVAFDSIDGAVRCAVKIQQQVPVYDGDQPPDRRIRFRIGINIGDVIPDGTDLHGDGVNIAARLEAASPVGGICVSRTVRDHVHGRLDLSFEPIGELTLKNIARPVEAFVLRLDPGAADKQSSDDTSGAIQARQPAASVRAIRPALVGGSCGTARLRRRQRPAGGSCAHPPATRKGRRQRRPPRPASRRGRSAMQAAVPPDVGLSNAPRLSLVVLPFDKMGGEGVEDYIVDGIAEDLTTDLSRLARLSGDRPQFGVHLQGQADRHQTCRRGAWRALRGGRQRAQGGWHAAYQRAAGFDRDRRAHLGGPLRCRARWMWATAWTTSFGRSPGN